MLERVRRRYPIAVAGYVVMPEHVHLLVNEPRRALLSTAIQALKLSVSVRSRERPFWQAHYYDFNISAYDKFVEKLRYIHRNPVRRGLVQKPAITGQCTHRARVANPRIVVGGNGSTTGRESIPVRPSQP